MVGPRKMVPGRPGLESHHSAKLLINRYESLGSPTKAPLTPPKLPLLGKKDKSPLRQSLKNFLAVIKKGGGLRSAKSRLQDFVTQDFAVPPQERVEKPQPIPPALTAPTKPLSTHAFPSPHLAGSLFRLTAPLEWAFCSAVLQGDTIHLTVQSTSLTHSVNLRSCTDVRSMTVEELSPEERAALAADLQDLRIFHVAFGGGNGEKFGATSVRERARWVSSIWDIVLPNASSNSSSTNTSSMFTDFSRSGGTDLTAMTRELSRALPPLPESPTSPTRSFRTNAISPSLYPPTRPASSGSSRSKSPSIANLSQLSVVKQRLAQMESHSVPCSPVRATKNPPMIRTRSLRIEIPTPIVARSAVSPTSILESYAEASALPDNSPPSPRAYTVDGALPQDRVLPSSSMQVQEDSRQGALLHDIHQLLSGVVQQTAETQIGISRLQTKIEAPIPTPPEIGSITRTLGDVHQKMRSDLPYIMKALADIQASQYIPDKNETAFKTVEEPLGRCVEKLDEILLLLKEDASQRGVQSQQQTDSVRYLNELNSWLEAFVSGGTAQIQVVANNVEKLCSELGCADGTSNNVLSELRNLLAKSQGRDHFEALQHSVNNLAAMVASGSSGGFTPQTVADLVEQQRHDHQKLLRTLAAELSSEIRGERLRFVDAMKEATAINVQMHVEELKKELNREVRADLFAYYSKQHQPQQRPQSCAPGQIYHHQQHQQMHPGRTAPTPRPMPDARTRYGGYA
ncbi:hypothetical protein MKEN_00646700 [Mycena kentingensis (nom. inval.)]|nr:hypothetical protein MKEN_00646700 [Mycena kentingensis (nom. inval.)]